MLKQMNVLMCLIKTSPRTGYMLHQDFHGYNQDWSFMYLTLSLNHKSKYTNSSYYVLFINHCCRRHIEKLRKMKSHSTRSNNSATLLMKVWWSSKPPRRSHFHSHTLQVLFVNPKVKQQYFQFNDENATQVIFKNHRISHVWKLNQRRKQGLEKCGSKMSIQQSNKKTR